MRCLVKVFPYKFHITSTPLLLKDLSKNGYNFVACLPEMFWYDIECEILTLYNYSQKS
jgi:hypothetical protein